MFYSGKALIQYEQETGQTSLNHERNLQGKGNNTAAWQTHHDIDPKYYRDASKHGIYSTIVQHERIEPAGKCAMYCPADTTFCLTQ